MTTTMRDQLLEDPDAVHAAWPELWGGFCHWLKRILAAAAARQNQPQGATHATDHHPGAP